MRRISSACARRTSPDDGGTWRNSDPAGPYVPQQPPNAVASVAVTRADGSLTASWDAVDGATKHHVTYTTDNGASWSLAALEHPSNSITFDVNNADTYIVGVRAGNDGGWSTVWVNSPASGPYTPPTPEPTPTPAPARGIVVQDSGGNPITALSIPEGGEVSYRVKLTAAPTEDVEVCIGLSVRDNDDSDITFKGEASDVVSLKLTFTPGNWSTAQTVTLVAAEDDADDVNGARDVTHDAREYYSGKVDITATEVDNDEITPPAAPTGLTAIVGGGSVTLSWDDPADASITGYQYRVNHNDTSTGKFSGWGDWQTITDGAAVSHTLDGLTNGREYRFKIRAVNAAGAGAIAPAADPWFIAASPLAPAAPSNFTVTSGDGYFDLDWDAVSGATAYDVRAKVANSNSWTSVATGVTATSYRYTTSDVVNVLAVRGQNAGGAGPWAELSRMPSNDWLNVVIQGGASGQSAQGQSQLAAPASLTVTRRNHTRDEKLYVTWAAVSGAGGYNLACANTPVVSNTPYSDVSWWRCGSVDSGSTTTFTVDEDKRGGITRDLGYNRSYAVAVRAVTADPAEASPWLLSADAHPALVPDGTTMSVSRNAGSVSFSWARPQHAQGYEIQCATRENNVTGAYTLCADVETATVANGRINVTISSWTAGGNNYTIDDTKTYDLKVKTTNAWGDSPYHFAPLIHPSMVSNLASTKSGDSSINSGLKQAVAFTTGSNTGGYVLKSITVPLKRVNSRASNLTLKLHAMEGSGQYSSTSEPSDTVLATLSGTAPTAATWTDTTYTCSGSGCDLSPDTTYFVVAAASDSSPAYAWAYARTETETALPSDNGWDVEFGHYRNSLGSRWGSWSDWNIAEIVFATNPSLDASNIGTHGATLTIANHGGVAWYYKHTNTGATCDGPVAAGTSTKALTSLTAGTSYTYSAYSDSSCTRGRLVLQAHEHGRDVRRPRGGGHVHEGPHEPHDGHVLHLQRLQRQHVHHGQPAGDGGAVHTLWLRQQPERGIGRFRRRCPIGSDRSDRLHHGAK